MAPSLTNLYIAGCLIVCLDCSLLFPCSHAVTPTISHSREPFFMPRHFPTCTYKAFNSFINTITPPAAFKAASSVDQEALCGANGTAITLRLRLLEANVSELALQNGFAGLLKELRKTLKLRYKWAVIMSGPFWMEYQSRSTAPQRSSPLQLKTTQTGKVEKGRNGQVRTGRAPKVDKTQCLQRGDVLMSLNRNKTLSDDGFDVLMAPRAIVAENSEFYLMMQKDCNLVVYSAAGYPLWGSRSVGKGSKCRLSLLKDGNLVIENENRVRVWASGSSISCRSVFVLIMQSDGNLVIYDMLSGVPIWATGTNQ